MEKTIVCFANSRKLGGRCVVGKTTDTYEWIRPLGTGNAGALFPCSIFYQNGGWPQVLDVMTIGLAEHKAEQFQTENWLIDTAKMWKKADTLDKKDVGKYTDTPESLWGANNSSPNGKNDAIFDVSSIKNSAYLISVSSCEIFVKNEGSKRKVRVQFEYNGVVYLLPMTDYAGEQEYLAKPNDTYPIEHPLYLCITLGLPYGGYSYLFVAGMIL